MCQTLFPFPSRLLLDNYILKSNADSNARAPMRTLRHGVRASSWSAWSACLLQRPGKRPMGLPMARLRADRAGRSESGLKRSGAGAAAPALQQCDPVRPVPSGPGDPGDDYGRGGCRGASRGLALSPYPAASCSFRKGEQAEKHPLPQGTEGYSALALCVIGRPALPRTLTLW